MPKTCGWPNCVKTAAGTKEAGWLCDQHAGDDLAAWLESLGVNEKTRAGVMDVVGNLGELKDIEEEDLADIKFSKVAEKKIRKALNKIGNQHVKLKWRGSTAAPLPPAFTEKWRDQVKIFEVPASAIMTDELIGTGGFARVYKGSIYGVPLAIKKFEVATSKQHEQYTELIKRESRPLSRVRHPNIIRLQHICLDPGHLAIATELAPHGSLDDYLQEHPDTSLAQRFFFGHGIVAGMVRLHTNCTTDNNLKPILHNDLKGANVLAGAMLEAKIADFGSSTGGHTTTTQGIGAAGTTLAYTAPEVMNKKQKSTRSDVYAFGVTLFELMTGRRAWEDMGPADIMASVNRSERPEILADCHPFIATTIRECWAQEPAERPSFDELNKRFNAARMAHGEFRDEPAQTSTSSSAGGRELVVVVSSPGKTLEQEEVMKMVEATAETRTDLIFGYDWEGSTAQDSRDTSTDWGDPDSVEQSFWFKGFRERVKGQVLVLAQQGFALRMLCIEGGPVSQLEARTMAVIRAEAIADLQTKGHTPNIATQRISFEAFKQAFALTAGPPSAGIRLGPPSETDRQRDREAETKVTEVKAEAEAEAGAGAKAEAEAKAKARAEAKTERLDAVAKVFNTAESTLVQLCSAATCAVLTTADQECDLDIGLDVSKQFTDRLESAAEQVFTPKDRYYDFATRVVVSLLQIVGEKGAALVEGVSGADLIACEGVIDIAKTALVAGPDRTITVEIKGLPDALGNTWNGNRTLHGWFGTFRMSHRVANGRPVYGLVDSNSNAKGCHGNFHYKELQVNVGDGSWGHAAWFASGCWRFGYKKEVGNGFFFGSFSCDVSSLDQIPSGTRLSFHNTASGQASSSTDFTVKGTETTSAATIDGIMAMPGMVAVMAAEEEAKAKELLAWRFGAR
jgi:serine/threonine protein kinase